MKQPDYEALRRLARRILDTDQHEGVVARIDQLEVAVAALSVLAAPDALALESITDATIHANQTCNSLQRHGGGAGLAEFRRTVLAVIAFESERVFPAAHLVNTPPDAPGPSPVPDEIGNLGKHRRVTTLGTDRKDTQ